MWVIEGVGSYGAQIARQTALAGYQVVEAARMGRTGRRGIGKSDPIDARRIATAVLPLAEEQLRTP
ncbi:IS110 family transposase, partial [Streptomyces sp. NPDC008061]